MKAIFVLSFMGCIASSALAAGHLSATAAAIDACAGNAACVQKAYDAAESVLIAEYDAYGADEAVAKAFGETVTQFDATTTQVCRGRIKTTQPTLTGQKKATAMLACRALELSDLADDVVDFANGK